MAICATPIGVRHEATEWKDDVYFNGETGHLLRTRSRLVFETELLSVESVEDIKARADAFLLRMKGGKA